MEKVFEGYFSELQKLEVKYRYDLVYSNDDILLPDDIFEKWYKEISEK